ncbi:ECF transporter S component [Faecalicatena contorta]|uniref:ECF transporter S component n=1 Tax=Faecalicatena contorta TaxID=39482 RepID=UPI001F251B59|nr:ECF transporter S component [Faecalicatena contorta]MCF2554802.1 ECF transporter S component [Faecalicatena contorta]
MELRTETLKIIVPVVLLLFQIPFLVVFERRKPMPRDIVPIAVLSVLGALGRVLFAAIPSFNPNSAIVIITGMQFGPLAGFLTGSMSALASNMLLGQGPWTLWQMTAWGIMGCLAGMFERMGWFSHRVVLYGFGFLSGILFGWFMNLQYLLGYVNPLTWKAFAASCASSFVFDLAHGGSTFLFLLIMERPWGRKLKRLRTKYGILEKRRQ